MNRSISTQAVSMMMAAVVTLAMLGGVQRLATSQPSPQLVAHVMQAASAART